MLFFFISINLLSFFIYGLDKWKAHHKKWRIPESVLLWLAVLGGSPAALLAMHFFHHKTLHKKFRYGIPVILVIQLTVAMLFYYYLYTSMA